MKVFEPVLLVSRTIESRAHMLNVSLSGALIHALLAYRVGDMLTIRVRTIDIVCRVVRTTEPRIGVMFTTPICSSTLTSLLG